MPATKLTVRSPTGRAWLMSALFTIMAGEVFYEVHKEESARLFNAPFTDLELLPWALVLAAIALGSIAWLHSLYLFPGSLLIDLDHGIIRRELKRRFSKQIYIASFEDFLVSVVYFSREHQQRGVFKRVELKMPEHEEVLLFPDLAEGERLPAALEQIADKLGSWEVKVEELEPGSH